MPYPAREIPFDARDFASHKSLLRVAAFTNSASVAARQTAIDYVVTAHAFSKDQTKSLLYAEALDKPGRNVRGDIQIGPSAFAQDQPWLACIVFHELVHSPQYAYYAAQGVTEIDPTRSEPERLMIALDEYEAYWWSLKRSAELALSQDQQTEIRRRARHALIDVDDAKASNLAQRQRFDEARDELIRQFKAKPAGAKVSATRHKVASCCA